jgi:hypothetical protein
MRSDKAEEGVLELKKLADTEKIAGLSGSAAFQAAHIMMYDLKQPLAARKFAEEFGAKEVLGMVGKVSGDMMDTAGRRRRLIAPEKNILFQDVGKASFSVVTGYPEKEKAFLKLVFDNRANNSWEALGRNASDKWEGFDIIRVDAYNDTNRPLTMVFKATLERFTEIKWQYAFLLKPGRNSIEIDMNDAYGSNLRSVNWGRNVSSWSLACVEKKAMRLYIENVSLEKHDEIFVKKEN